MPVYIARDKDDALYVYKNLPERSRMAWFCEGELIELESDDSLGKGLTWEDEPVELICKDQVTK